MSSRQVRVRVCSTASALVFAIAQPALAQDRAGSQAAVVPQATSALPASETADIVVTAQKRVERLQDVPVPVSVISPQMLAQTAQVRLQDYYSTVPGLSVSPSGTVGNEQNIVIRGISSGTATNSTVGVTVDDVPFGSSISYAGNITPDFDPSDLARIEVLRGPQGTLYGASSMGGLLKFETVDPSTSGVSGRLEAGINGVHNGAEPGYDIRGAINVPLTPTLAIRASGFTRQDAGYIDNPLQNRSGVNQDHVSGGRISALWRPSETFKVKLSALYQVTRASSTSEVDILPGLRDLQQNSIIGCCAFNKKLQAYTAVVTTKLGLLDLTSVTGYNVSSFDTTLDYSYLLGGYSGPAFGSTAVLYHPTETTRKVTQELRATLPVGRALDLLVGGFYQHEDSTYNVNIPVLNQTTGAQLGNFAYLRLPYEYAEFAVFTDLTIHLTDRINVQVGGRESFTNQTDNVSLEQGPLFGGNFVVPAVSTKPHIFTYQVTPQFKISHDLMVYARVASGYRPGSPNVGNPDPLIPKAAEPDRTTNYEVGAKGDLISKKLSFDISLFYIDWRNIQFQLLDLSNDLAYGANGSGAKSEGVEVALDAKPTRGLTLRGWYTFDNAVLTKNVPAGSTVYGPAGSRLPFGARNSANIAADQKVELGGDVTGSFGGELSYQGDRVGTFITTPNRAVYPAFTKLDLRLGLAYKNWSATIYADNVTDRRGAIGGGAGTFPPYSFYYIQPRTIGATLARTF